MGNGELESGEFIVSRVFLLYPESNLQSPLRDRSQNGEPRNPYREWNSHLETTLTWISSVVSEQVKVASVLFLASNLTITVT